MHDHKEAAMILNTDAMKMMIEAAMPEHFANALLKYWL
jgi:hypothetical protein